MEIQQAKFQFAITTDDLRTIRSAIIEWGKPSECVQAFTGAMLHRHFERWEQFVATDWGNWDISEYDHDIGCRYWIQVSIEHSCATTRRILEQQVFPLDEAFKARMKPTKQPKTSKQAPLAHYPYFWETHTIHPDL